MKLWNLRGLWRRTSWWGTSWRRRSRSETFYAQIWCLGGAGDREMPSSLKFQIGSMTWEGNFWEAPCPSLQYFSADASHLDNANRAAELINQLNQLEEIRSLVLQSREGQDYQQERVLLMETNRRRGDFLATNLSMMILTSNRNERFANSVFRCWYWLTVYAPMAFQSCWGAIPTSHGDVAGYFRSRWHRGGGPIGLWHPLDKEAGDFVYSLWRLSAMWMARRSLAAYGAVEAKESVPLDIPYKPYEENGITLQELINHREHGQHLLAGQSALVLQFGRFYSEGGEWKKHHLEVELGSIVQLERSAMMAGTMLNVTHYAKQWISGFPTSLTDRPLFAADACSRRQLLTTRGWKTIAMRLVARSEEEPMGASCCSTPTISTFMSDTSS